MTLVEVLGSVRDPVTPTIVYGPFAQVDIADDAVVMLLNNQGKVALIVTPIAAAQQPAQTPR